MTREEAIENLKGCVCGYEIGKDGKPNGNVTADLTQETINMAIKALEAEPCEDCISRERALFEISYCSTGHSAKKIVSELPSVTPARPKGKWECQSNEDTDTWYCNMCHKQGCQVPKGCTPNIIFDNYCSYCGSYMKGGEDDEEKSNK